MSRCGHSRHSSYRSTAIDGDTPRNTKHSLRPNYSNITNYTFQLITLRAACHQHSDSFHIVTFDGASSFSRRIALGDTFQNSDSVAYRALRSPLKASSLMQPKPSQRPSKSNPPTSERHNLRHNFHPQLAVICIQSMFRGLSGEFTFSAHDETNSNSRGEAVASAHDITNESQIV